MLDWQSKETQTSLIKLVNAINESEKPILLWIGAGASKWNDFPLWEDLADIFHKTFKKDKNYILKDAFENRDKGLPNFFSYCKSVNHQLYNRTLADIFSNSNLTPVYSRFLEAIKDIKSPLRIVTTNIDENLERNLSLPVVQRSDLERVGDLVSKNSPFIIKLHGSISSIDSLVFTDEDYAKLTTDKGYINSLSQLLLSHSVVFIGYGLGDEYILNILQENNSSKDIFGDGPHFAILPQKNNFLPTSVNQINYMAEPHKDHRTAIRIIESPKFLMGREFKTSSFPIENPKSIHFITDIVPNGTWQSSQEITLSSTEGGASPVELKAYIGTGFTNSELPNNNSTAMHDLIVGLMCFDQVLLPLAAAGRVHDLLGGDLFWELVKSNILIFINWTFDTATTSPLELRMQSGSLGSFSAVEFKTVEENVRSQFSVVKGKEKEAEEGFINLINGTIQVSENDQPAELITEAKKSASKEGFAEIPGVADITRGLLVYPEIREMLAMSEGTSAGAVPPWLNYPILRLAEVAKIGLTAKALNIPSVKLLFGLSGLASPVFSTYSSDLWIDEVVGYIVAGDYDFQFGDVFIQNKDFINSILKFRDTNEGVSLRKEILERLQTSDGAEIPAAINGNLKSILNTSILKNAKSKLAGLMTLQGKNNVNALWNNKAYDQDAMQRWRVRSKKMFEEYCATHNVSPYELCPCGSGDKVKFCCGAL